MNVEQLQHRETLLIELLLSSLDTRETGRAIGSTMLTYLSNLLVRTDPQGTGGGQDLNADAGGKSPSIRGVRDA